MEDNSKTLDSLLLCNIKKNINGVNAKYKYPLIANTYDHEEIYALCKFLISGEQLTMGQNVANFEDKFAKYVGARYAVMVNSGSSANLLAVATLTNFMFDGHLNPGDEVIVPIVCWSTTVWPLIQHGLVPIFVDIDAHTFNINVDELQNKISNKTKGIMLVHIMGNSCDMEPILKLAKKYNLRIIEDTCESLGSKYDDIHLGTFGDFGTYSFYFSHHITTIEGGMVVTNDKNSYELLKCIRSHGWIRYFEHNKKKEYIDKFKDVDERYMFVNTGYNLRPMELQAVMGLIQLSKLESKNENRIYNFNLITNKIKDHPKNKDLIYCQKAMHNSYNAWFGLCLCLNIKFENIYKEFMKYLEDKLIENRPIVTGNFARQPYFTLTGKELSPIDYPKADYIHKCGFYIGLSCNKCDETYVNELVDIIFAFFH